MSLAQQTDRPPAITLTIAVAALVLIACCVAFQQPRGDEPRLYMPVVVASSNCFPALNQSDVAYGISPFWTWSTGMLSSIGLSTVLAGRLVSLIGWITCGHCLFRSRVNVIGLLCLVHPVTLVLAARCHPFWLAMAFLLIATRARHRLVKYILLFASGSVQPFLIPAAAAIALLQTNGTIKTRLIESTLMAAATVAGMLSNWLLYGGQYPAEFRTRPCMEPYLTFDGFEEIYLVLVPAGAGLLLWLTGSRKANLLPVTVIGIATFFVALAVGFTSGISQGFFASAALVAGRAKVVVWSLFMACAAAGLSRLSRTDWGLALCMLAITALLSRLPFPYERYMWQGVMPVFWVKGMIEGVETEQSLKSASYGAAALLLGVFYCFKSSL